MYCLLEFEVISPKFSFKEKPIIKRLKKCKQSKTKNYLKSIQKKSRVKLIVIVDFSIDGLDLSFYSAKNISPFVYNLYAISNHTGTNNSSHYTAYCKYPYTGRWQEYYNGRVSTVSSNSLFFLSGT